MISSWNLIMTNYQINFEDVTPIGKLQFEMLDTNYRKVCFVGLVSTYLVLALLALLLLLTGYLWPCLLAEGLVVAAAIVNIMLLPKALRFKGYAFRENDLSYRSGIIFPTVTTVPYVRIQQISVNQNPVTRFFKLCSLDIANGAQQFSSLRIPGLTEEKANRIKSMLMEKINNQQNND